MMTEIFKSLFQALLLGFNKYFKPTVFAIMAIMIIWFMSNDREDKNNSDENCEKRLKDYQQQLAVAQSELSDTRKQLLAFALKSHRQQQNTAKNDSVLRKQTQIQNIMP